MSEKSNWQLFVEDFKSLSDEDKHKAWNYIKALKNGEVKKTKKRKIDFNHFTGKTREFCIEILDKHDMDMNTSIYVTCVNNISLTVDEILEKYFNKNIEKKPYIVGNEDLIKDMIQYHYDQLEHEGIEAFPYLRILNKETQDFVMRINKETNFNLYHSAYSYCSNRINKSVDEIIGEYIKKYSEKRPYLKENMDCVKELFSKVLIKTQNDKK